MNLRFNLAKKHAHHYLALLNEINQQYLLGGNAIAESITIFNREIDQIQEAQIWAASQSETSDGAAHLVENFADWGADLLLLRLPMGRYQDWLIVALQAAQKLRLRRAESVHYGNLGIVQRRLNDFEAAISSLQTALQIALELNDIELQGWWQGNSGHGVSGG